MADIKISGGIAEDRGLKRAQMLHLVLAVNRLLRPELGGGRWRNLAELVLHRFIHFGEVAREGWLREIVAFDIAQHRRHGSVLVFIIIIGN